MAPLRPARLPRALFAVLAVAVLIHFIPACGGGGGQDGGDQATVAFSVATSSGDESATPAQIAVELSAPLASANAVVDVTVTGGSANAGTDFSLATTTISIPAGGTRGTADLDIVQDGFDEPDETVELTISNPRTVGTVSAGLTLGANRTHTYTVKAQSASATPVLSLQRPAQAVDEGVGSATVVVELSRAAAGPVTVDYAVTGGNATPGTDYSLPSGTLTVPAGLLAQTFSIPIADDSIDEDDETVVVTLSNPSGAQLGGPATATITISDNDSTPTINFSLATLSANENDGTASLPIVLTNPSGRDITVSYAAATNGTASGNGVDYSLAGTTLTIPAGQTTASIPVTIVDDTLAEGGETVNVILSSPVNAALGINSQCGLTIIDNDGLPLVEFSTATASALENGGPATITLALSSASTSSTIQVNYTVTGGSATRGPDFTLADGLVTFSIGQTTRPITIGLVGDSIDEDDETIVITLSNPVNATLGARSTHTFTITDDDPSPQLAFAGSAFSSSEGSATATIAVNLAGVTARTVAVNYAVTGGTATSPDDFTLANGTLTFAPGETSKPVTINVANDALDENNETIVVALSSPMNGVLGSVSTTTCTILDDDPMPTVAFGAAGTSDSESTASPAIPVFLSAASGRVVTVGYAVGAGGTATGGGTDYTLPTGTLTFPIGTTTAFLPIAVVDDNRDEADETVPITLSGPVGATLGSQVNYTFTINDDDPSPTIQFQAATSAGSESSLQAFLVVSLSAPSSQTVTVSYAWNAAGGLATAADFSVGGTGTLSFAPGIQNQNILLNIVNDTLSEDDETIQIVLSNPANGTLGTQTTHTYTIQDNDPLPTVQFAQATSSQPESITAPPITVTLSAAAGRPVTVVFSVIGGTATSPADYTLALPPMGFNAGQTSKSIPLTVVDDAVLEPNETITLQLSSPGNATLGAQATHTFTIINND